MDPHGGRVDCCSGRFRGERSQKVKTGAILNSASKSKFLSVGDRLVRSAGGTKDQLAPLAEGSMPERRTWPAMDARHMSANISANAQGCPEVFERVKMPIKWHFMRLILKRWFDSLHPLHSTQPPLLQWQTRSRIAGRWQSKNKSKNDGVGNP